MTCHLQMNEATLTYLVALMPLHTCHCDLLSRVQNIFSKKKGLFTLRSILISLSTERSELRVCFMVSLEIQQLALMAPQMCAKHWVKLGYSPYLMLLWALRQTVVLSCVLKIACEWWVC